jgi:hypothetical protein
VSSGRRRVGATKESGFAPKSSEPVVKTQRTLAGHTLEPEDDEDDEDEWKRRGSSPAFRAIFLATRILTPDPSSVLQTDLAPSSLIAYLAHSLVSHAQEEGITVKEPQQSRRVSVSRQPGRERRRQTPNAGSTYGEQAMQITASLSSALAGVGVDPRKFIPSSRVSAVDARRALLRSLPGGRPEGRTSEGSATPRTPVTAGSAAVGDTTTTPPPPSSSPTRTMPAVELNSIGSWSSRPPTLLPRRNTLDDFLHLDRGDAKVASQFDGKDVKPYTDRYGFVCEFALAVVGMVFRVSNPTSWVSTQTT